MRFNWAHAASLALAVAFAGTARAESEDFSQWDEKHAPIEGRPGEYRTTATDTWIRLTPHVGAVLWDGGTQLENGAQIGVALEFDAAEVVIASIDLGVNVADGAARQFTENRNGTDGDEELDGTAIHIAAYLGLKNPELRAGALQTIIGLGFGAFFLTGYEGSLPVAGGGTADVEFKDSVVGHATLFIRFDFDVSEHVKLGFDFKSHILLYATEENLGNMEADKFGLDNLHYALEPSFYLSFTF